MNTLFKKNKYAAFIVGVSICALAACTKLQTNVYSVVQPDNFWLTPDQVTAGVAPAYSGFPTSISIGGNIMTMQEGPSDEFVVPTRGADWGDAGHWDALWNHTYERTNSNWNSGWTDIFGAISSCNLILQAVNGLSPAPSTLPTIQAQVKTLRAYYYYQAMSIFGNVPVVTDTTTSTTPSTEPRATVFNFIVSDLKASLPILSTTVDATTYGRVTRYFAFALLARLYLNAAVFTGTPGTTYTKGTADYVQAIAYCDSVLAGPYSLMPNYFDNFTYTNGPGSTENIYAYPCDHINNLQNNWENAILHYQGYLAFGMSTGNNLWNGYCSAANFYSSFDTTSTYSQDIAGGYTFRTYMDMRSGQWLYGQQFKGTYNYPPYQNVKVAGPSSEYIIDAQTNANLAFNPNFTLFSDPSADGRIAGVRNIKYFPSPSSGVNGTDMDNDMVVFRLAEIMLIKAEAAFRSGDQATALSMINAVRARAYGNTSHDLAAVTLPAILAEKGREMAYEGVRREDLIRYELEGGGPYFTGARDPGKTADADQHYMVFPIPAQQITANANLKQNPGY